MRHNIKEIKISTIKRAHRYSEKEITTTAGEKCALGRLCSVGDSFLNGRIFLLSLEENWNKNIRNVVSTSYKLFITSYK